MSDVQKHTGVTAEGLPFEVIITYEPGAPDGSPALLVTGSYGAEDGPGEFRIERAPDGLYYRTGDPEGRKIPDELFPWVVSDGEILKTTAL